MNPPPKRPAGIAFGRFLVLPDRRDLIADGSPVKLGGRAFDVLMALIEVPGAVVSRDALKARVWPNRTVEDNNLAAQIVALRKAFGSEQGLIRTVAGRGYQFTGAIRPLSAATDEAPDVATVAAAEPIQPPTNLREQVTQLIGPALLAQHCTEAGLVEKALAYWLIAGQQALTRSAMTEAVAQLQKGLNLLAGLPDGPRQEQELDLQIALRPALTATNWCRDTASAHVYCRGLCNAREAD